MIRKGSGVLTPADLGQQPSNNLMELIAVIRALESLPRGWKGPVYTDSKVTIARLTRGFPVTFAGKHQVPGWLRSRWFRIRMWKAPTFVHVGGHPTREELRAGRRRGGQPCSKWNVWCDNACRLAAEKIK